MEKKDEYKLVKIVSHAFRADGKVTNSEEEFLEWLMERYELGESERAEIAATSDEEFDQLIGEIAESNARSKLITTLALAIAADYEIDPRERALIDRVALALGADPDELDAILEIALAQPV